MYMIVDIIYMIIDIRRPLPELERASLQLQSPMPSNPSSPKPAILTHLEASQHPSIQVSLTAGIPYSIIFKGSQVAPAGRHRGFQPADLHPQSLPILTHLEASIHPSIQASLTAGIPHWTILKGSQIRPAGVHRVFLVGKP